VAGPESANNACASGALLPMLTLGIPGSGGAAVLLGVFIMYGIQPGPLLFQNNPDLVWGLINSMYVGNVMLLVLNLPLVGLFVRLLHVPRGILFPIVLAISVLGVYGARADVAELYLLLAFGLPGYVLNKLDIPPGPLILGVVLGGPLEQSFRQSMKLSGGSLGIFVSTPLAAILSALATVAIIAPYLRGLRAHRPRPARAE